MAKFWSNKRHLGSRILSPIIRITMNLLLFMLKISENGVECGRHRSDRSDQLRAGHARSQAGREFRDKFGASRTAANFLWISR